MATVLPSTSPEPVISLARAKQHCKITGTERDEEVTDAVEAARAWAQEITQRAIGGEQTLERTYEQWLGRTVLPFAPSEIISITGADVVLDYTLSGRIVDAVGSAPVTVKFKVLGYTAETLPAPIKMAMLLVVGDLLVNQQGQVETQLYENKAALNLLWPYRLGLGV